MRLTLSRPPKDNEELHSLVKALWGVNFPTRSVCDDHVAPFSVFADAFFARAPQILLHGSRGLSGKSFMASKLGLTQAVILGCDVNILGGSFAQSTNVLGHISDAWAYENAPKYMLAEDTTQQQTLTNNAKIRPLKASQRSVRGPHPARLLLDEIDEMDQKILEASYGQPMPQVNWLGAEIPAATLMVSTWQRADGPMSVETKRMNEAGLPVVSYCYKENLKSNGGWLDPVFVEQKKLEIPKEMWRIEYELGEPSIGNRAIDTDAVERMFDTAAPVPLKHTSSHREYVILKPRNDRDYVIAADWAKSQDWTIIVVFDVTETPIRMAYFLKIQRNPYPYMVGLFNKLAKMYNAEAIHDATGLGSVVSDLIDTTNKVRNFQMAGRQRDDMLSDFVAAVENDQIRAANISELHSIVKYASVEDLFSRGKEYHLPDEICAMGLAWHLVRGNAPLTSPWSLAKDDELETAAAKAVENNSVRTVGEVRRTSEEFEFSLS